MKVRVKLSVRVCYFDGEFGDAEEFCYFECPDDSQTTKDVLDFISTQLAQYQKDLMDYFSSSSSLEIKACTVNKFCLAHGGARLGSGQPSKYGEATKVVRLPQSLVDKMDLIVAIPQLQQLIKDWDEQILQNPKVRTYDKLKKFLSEVKALGF